MVLPLSISIFRSIEFKRLLPYTSAMDEKNEVTAEAAQANDLDAAFAKPNFENTVQIVEQLNKVSFSMLTHFLPTNRTQQYCNVKNHRSHNKKRYRQCQYYFAHFDGKWDLMNKTITSINSE